MPIYQLFLSHNGKIWLENPWTWVVTKTKQFVASETSHRSKNFCKNSSTTFEAIGKICITALHSMVKISFQNTFGSAL